MIVRYFIIISLYILLIGCTSAPSKQSELYINKGSIKNKQENIEKLPDWLSSSPNGYVSACVKVKGNDIYTAKIIVRAKAKAELLSTREVNIESEISITQTSSTLNKQSIDSADFKSKMNLKTSGNIDHTYKVIKEEVVFINKVRHLCVLFG